MHFTQPGRRPHLNLLFLSHRPKHSKNLPPTAGDAAMETQKVQLRRKSVNLAFRTQRRPNLFTLQSSIRLTEATQVHRAVQSQTDWIKFPGHNRAFRHLTERQLTQLTTSVVVCRTRTLGNFLRPFAVQLIQLILIVSHLALVPVSLMLLSFCWLTAITHLSISST